MKVDRSKLKKSTSEVPPECQNLIDKLKSCSNAELLDELSQVDNWTFGKCELYHWIDVLDIFDTVLEEASQTIAGNRWALACDVTISQDDKKLLLWVLHFTTLLIEHSFSRHLYNSMEHLNTLLASSDMQVVLGVLNLLYMFSKRSNFITRLSNDKRQVLLLRLQYLAESWGGKDTGFGLADCCNNDKPIPATATTLHFEFYCNNNDSVNKNGKQLVNYIHIENIDKMLQTPAEIMRGLMSVYNIPPEKEMLLFTHVRLAHCFSDYKNRLFCVQARLQALSVLVYSNALQDNAHLLLYPGLLEELVELLELQLPYLVEIRSAALRTLTSIIHLDRNPHFPKKPGSRLNMIIDVTGASLYHGFLPQLVRTCISTLTQSQRSNSPTNFPLPLATALFSFLYHLASYEAGGDALVNCGIMESLLHVINWHGFELEHITFVTRAVRVIDLITNIDMQCFQAHGGLANFINRLNVEVNICRQEQPFEIKVKDSKTEETSLENITEDSEMSTLKDYDMDYSAAKIGKTCLPQRAALLKSMLNFLKKAIQDPVFGDNIRHVMEGTLPSSLKHIISNAEYYGPSLFLLATDVVTVYVFQEPSLLSSLQDNGLTDVVLHALLIKDVPATREVLGSLPNVFSALCLNARGLASFVKCKPFERLFKVLLSPNYLPAMRRRRSSDPLGDTASNLGNAMDELMRHQPSLKVDATAAIIKLLQELCQLGTDSKYVCHRAHSKPDTIVAPASRPSGNAEAGSSDEDDEDEEEASTSSHTQRDDNTNDMTTQEPNEKTPIVLVDYILNVMKFVDAVLSNNSTDDHCKEFVKQGGLVPLLKILGLPNLPVDCPVTAAAQAVASVCKSILNLAHESKVLKQGLTQLGEVLQSLKPLCSNLDKPGTSILLHELANAPNLETAFTNPSATPLLHAMNAAHGYVLMFVHVCRTGQSEIRNLSLQHWGSDDGLAVLSVLAELYTSLVWESTLLLALCSEDVIPANCDFGKSDMDKLVISLICYDKSNDNDSSVSSGSMTSAMEALTTNPPVSSMDIDTEPSASNQLGEKKKDERSVPTSQQLKYIKPLLGSSSRLGRALAELFGLLVKLCVGSPIRQRRGQNIVTTPPFPGPFARQVATALNKLLASGLNWEKLPPSPIPKFRLTFLICSVGFTSPMLFDEKRYPYHLMLQKFVSLGGQQTFFATFRWALSAGGKIPLEQGLEHPDLPDGTGEFLDAWLMLLEKMVNPKAILDSPHVISKGNVRGTAFKMHGCQFDPLQYLIQIHKLAFEAVKLLWGKKPLHNYGSRMTESMLSIMRHILRGEKIIKERMSKIDENMETRDEETTSATNTTTNTTSTTNTAAGNSAIHADINNDHMYQLLDMGFEFERIREALLHTTTMEQATEYLLNNSAPTSSTSDPVIQATIAMSLSPLSDMKQSNKKPEKDDYTPLTEEAINEFTQTALPTCLNLLDVLPDAVYRVCDLLVTITKRNGEIFRDQTLDVLLSEIGNNMMTMIKNGQTSNSSFYDDIVNGEAAQKMAVRLHLFTLLFEGPVFQEMRIPCAEAIHRSGILPAFVKLLVDCEHYMQSGSQKTTTQILTPKWLTPLLLLLDLVEKVSLCTQRKDLMHKVTTRIWQWFDLANGKWTPYSSPNNKIINDAYWNNENSVRVTCGRRRYTITFSTMTQMNEESGNNRPVSMTLASSKEDSDRESVDLDDPYELTEKERKRNVPVEGLSTECQLVIVKTCVKLMALPAIDRDTLHAILRICLRLTRDFTCARIFAEQGGVKLLLEVKQASAFTGFVTLATLLIRHVLEEPRTLDLAMEKVIRARTLNTIPPTYKEILYLTRQVSAAVCRNSDAFYDISKSILRIDTNYLHRRNDEEDTRILVRCEPPTRSAISPMDEEVSIGVIYDLLNALVKPTVVLDNNTNMMISEEPPLQSSTISHNVIPQVHQPISMYRRTTDVLRGPQSDSLQNDNGDDITNRRRYRDGSSNNNGNKTLPDDEAKKPLLLKPALLKLLAEAVKSYSAIAKIITDFQYKADQSEMITEDCSALAFMLDKLLPINENVSDPECSMMTRMLLASIASCNHSPDAQSTLVRELKEALGRALTMPETAEKHTQIQMLTGLICTMIENCPTSQPQPFRNIRIHGGSNHNPNVANNIVKIMIRKGLLADLAKVPQFLDLSSPNMVITVNAMLKPLETLSRIVNQPSNNGTASKFIKPKGIQSTSENPLNQSGTTSTEATNAQGEDPTEDLTENTEHDISTAVESLEPSEGQAQEDNDVAGLEETLFDQILERDGQRNNRNYNDVSSGRTHSMDIDEDAGEMRNLVYDTERDVTVSLFNCSRFN